MPLYRIRRTFKFCLVLCSAVLFVSTVRGHDTVVYDNKPGLTIGGAGNITGPLALLAMANVYLRPQNLAIDVTMADAAAYNLLNSDPFTSASGSPGNSDAHFQQDQPLLIQRAATLFTLTNNGAPFVQLTASVEMTASQDIIFHLIYPPTPSGIVHLQVNCFDRASPDKMVVIQVMDAADHAQRPFSVVASMPSMDIDTAPPVLPTAIKTPISPIRHWLGVIAGVVGGLAVFWLLIKLRQTPAKD